MTDKYCPSGEVKKLEAELWNLKVKGTDVVHSMVQLHQKVFKSSVYASTTTFLSIFKSSVCVAILHNFRMFPEESDKIERYVGGLPDMIHGSAVASKPKTMQEAIEMEMN
ncbi:hypothetical protein Tco_0696006 [Tanacetum coccineum]